jgi:putative heme iron utilization protein
MKHNPWEFIRSLATLHISSINDDGTPHSSYAPFIENEKKFYICISSMAKHTHNVLRDKITSIMMLEDESKSSNLFARKRVTFDVSLTPIQRDSLLFNGAMTLFEDKFGNSAGIYKNMPDFQLLELTPTSGRGLWFWGSV